MVDEKINSNEVPKHRRKRLFMLQNYISESEGVLATSSNLMQNDGCCPLVKKKTVKSNANLLVQTAERLKQNYNDRTLNSMVNYRRIRRTSSIQMS